MTQEHLENLEKIGLNAEAINDAIEKVEMAIRVLTPEAQHEQLTAELYDDFFDDYGSITNEIIEQLFASAKRVIEDNSSYHVLYVANEENSHLMYPEGGENPENDQFVDISEKDSDLINMPVGRLIETLREGWDARVGEELCWRAGNIDDWDRGDPKAATEKAAEILGYDLIKEENHE